MSDFDVVMRVGPAFVLRDGPKPRPPSDRHGCVDGAGGERIAVWVQGGRFWPPPPVLAAGAALAAASAAGTLAPSLVRTHFFGEVRNEHWHVVERTGGVALPALVRRVRKKDGALPLSFAVRIARDVAAAQAWLEAEGILRGTRRRRDGAVLPGAGDVVVGWDGRVAVAPRLFGSPADEPRWSSGLHDAPAVTAALLVALLAPPSSGDVDAHVVALLARQAQARRARPPAPPEPLLAKAGAPVALVALVELGLAAAVERGRPLPAAEVRATLDAVLTELGGDNERFAASMVEELYASRKKRDLEWREELQAAPLLG